MHFQRYSTAIFKSNKYFIRIFLAERLWRLRFRERERECQPKRIGKRWKCATMHSNRVKVKLQQHGVRSVTWFYLCVFCIMVYFYIYLLPRHVSRVPSTSRSRSTAQIRALYFPTGCLPIGEEWMRQRNELLSLQALLSPIFNPNMKVHHPVVSDKR